MGVHAASASLVVSGEPAPGGDATELRRMTDELIMVGVDALAKAPLQDVFAIYTAVRNPSGSPRSDRSRADLDEPARGPRRRRAVAAPGDLAAG